MCYPFALVVGSEREFPSLSAKVRRALINNKADSNLMVPKRDYLVQYQVWYVKYQPTQGNAAKAIKLSKDDNPFQTETEIRKIKLKVQWWWGKTS